jgi:hypothetical protein
MKHGTMKSRILASTLVGVLAPVAPFVALLASSSSAQAAPDVQNAECQIRAVLASKTGDEGIPEELSFLKAQLSGDEFAAYKSFHLVDQKALKIQLGKASEVKFRSGNRIGLSLLGNDDKRLKIHAELSSRDGKKPLLAADLTFTDGSVVMVRAGTYEHENVSGKLFFAIQCVRGG